MEIHRPQVAQGFILQKPTAKALLLLLLLLLRTTKLKYGCWDPSLSGNRDAKIPIFNRDAVKTRLIDPTTPSNTGSKDLQC